MGKLCVFVSLCSIKIILLEWVRFRGYVGTVFSAHQVQIAHDAYHEVVRVGMAFQVVYLCLLEVAYVAHVRSWRRDGLLCREVNTTFRPPLPKEKIS